MGCGQSITMNDTLLIGLYEFSLFKSKSHYKITLGKKIHIVNKISHISPSKYIYTCYNNYTVILELKENELCIISKDMIYTYTLSYFEYIKYSKILNDVFN